jgi:hypothetical protein
MCQPAILVIVVPPFIHFCNTAVKCEILPRKHLQKPPLNHNN